MISRFGTAVCCSLGVAAFLAACGSTGHARTTSSSVAATAAQTSTGASGGTYTRPPAGVAAVQLDQPFGSYTVTVYRTLARLDSELAALSGALARNDPATARSTWLQAHLTWLSLGEDDAAYGAFGQLGNRIDGTAAGDFGGTASSSFTGFHRVEYDLYRRHDPAAARRDTATLRRLVAKLTPDTISKDLQPTPTNLDAWVLRPHEVLEDAVRDTLSGADDYGSHSALPTLAADVKATRGFITLLSGLLDPRAPGLVREADRQLSAVTKTIGRASLAPVSALPLRRRQQLDADVDAAVETLAPVSDLMQITNSNS